jgi:hypothetical protein
MRGIGVLRLRMCRDVGIVSVRCSVPESFWFVWDNRQRLKRSLSFFPYPSSSFVTSTGTHRFYLTLRQALDGRMQVKP